jgi:hypothetical protein
MRGPAQATGALARHADGLRRDIDEAGIGQRLDEAALLLLGPAIGPGDAADGDPAILGGVLGNDGWLPVVVLERGGWRGGAVRRGRERICAFRERGWRGIGLRRAGFGIARVSDGREGFAGCVLAHLAG